MKLNAEREKLQPPTESIPMNSWLSKHFPRELSESVMEVVQNAGIAMSVKIRNVVELIVQSYKSTIQDLSQELQTAKNERHESLRGFLTGLGRALELPNLSIVQIDGDPLLAAEICEKIRSLRETNANLLQEKSKSEEDMLQFFVKLKVNSFSEAILEIDRNAELMKALELQLRRERRKVRKLERNEDRIGKEVSMRERELEKIFGRQSKQIRAISKENAEFLSDLETSQVEIERLKRELNNLNESHAKTLDALRSELSESLKSLTDESQQERESLTKRIEEQNQQIRNLQSDLEKSKQQLSQMKRTSKLMKSAMEQKDNKITQLRVEMTQTEKKFAELLCQERKSIHARCDEALEQMRVKNAGLQKFLQQATTALSDCEARACELSAANSQLKIEKAEVLARFESKCDQWKREREKFEAKIKAVELANDITVQNKVDEEKSEKERMKLFSIIRNCFREYVDSSRVMDFEYVREVLERVADDVGRLGRQDSAVRKVLGIGPRQALEDAVAKILLSIYHP
jgi:gas vesicle protein